MSMLEDGEIVRRMRHGDVTGLEGLLRQYGPTAKAWLRVRFGLPMGDHMLEDAVHDAALILFRRAHRLDASNNLGGFFYTTASRELIRGLRQQNGGPQLWDKAGLNIPAPEPNPEPGAFSIALAAYLQSFPEREREILGQDAASGFSMSAAEVAALLGTTAETVYSLRNRAKKRLDEFLHRWKDRGTDATPRRRE